MSTNPDDMVSGPTFINFSSDSGRISVSDRESTVKMFSEGLKNHPGLSKREYFAAMAMQGYCSLPIDPIYHALGKIKTDEFLDRIANQAVNQADALIEALNKKE